MAALPRLPKERAGIGAGRGDGFSRLAGLGVDPILADAPGVGGPDFLCLQGKPKEFMVEATSLLPNRVTQVSNIPNRVPEDMEGGPFALLTAQIDETATKKLPQFREIAKPGILTIASRPLRFADRPTPP
jgi:hypothetical protein